MGRRRNRAWVAAGAAGVLALVTAAALVVAVVGGTEEPTEDEAGQAARDPSFQLIRDAEGERVEFGRDQGAIEAGVSEELGIRALELSEDAGIHEHTRTHGALVLDFDGDGLDDLLINRHYFAYPRLYRNRGDGTFADVTGNLIPRAERDMQDPHGCDAADVNQNGRLDIFCTTGGRRGEAPNPKKLWIQQPDGTFRDRTRTFRLLEPWIRGREVTFLDATGNGYPDLFHGATHPRADGRESPSRLLINEGGERFRHAPELGVDGERDAAAVEAIDYDGSGRDDLMVCGSDGMFLFRNTGDDAFEEVAAASGLDVPRCRSAAFGRFERGPRPGLVYLDRDGVHVMAQRDGRFEARYFLAVSDAFEVAVGDVDGDGLDDIYVLRRGAEPDQDFADLMLVNRAGGERFVNMAIPQSRRGAGESVTAIDYTANGLTDFVVMNGKWGNEGPIRLIAFERLPGD